MNYTLTRHAILRFIGAVATAAIAVLLTGCNPNKMGGELSERIEMDGYSFLPPVDPGWLIASRSTQKITLLKSGNMDGQSYLIEGEIGRAHV